MKDRGERPEWVEELIAGRTEWTLYDSETDRLRTVTARTQKEAIKMALSLGIVPRKPMDVHPRENGNSEVMSPEEFEEFMSSIRQ